MFETIHKRAVKYQLIGEWEKAKEIIREGINNKITEEERDSKDKSTKNSRENKSKYKT
ncbi:MAG: hypothetical protein KGD59_02350 [Candidatus Heimdallarchaeota archaeon]|nr:hypothetical protein [Candidatus Heimdallarchaeota archaeon]MBY8993363.1 hypothetical protein [Candidatus Heimdallarchaeota archaeon]